jgi:hypothetical protein
VKALPTSPPVNTSRASVSSLRCSTSASSAKASRAIRTSGAPVPRTYRVIDRPDRRQAYGSAAAHRTATTT